MFPTIFLALFALLSSTQAYGPRQSIEFWTGWANVEYLFTFGDSYTSTVFNIHGEQPNPGNPLGNPPYPGSTSSGGPNYVDYLTTTYNESYIQTYNLGFGGGTVDHLLLPSTFSPNVLSFDQQVQQEFIPTYGDQVAVPWSAANSLVTIFFGINDVLLALPKHNDSLNCAIIKSYENLVHQLYDTGLRNFVFMNVPPLDRDPGSLHQDANYQASLAHDIGVWNFRLQNVANNLAANFPESTVFQFDTNWLFTLVLNDPTSFPETSGFLNTTGACKAYLHDIPSPLFNDPSCNGAFYQYLWKDNIHITYPMHNFIASQIVQLLDG